VINLTFELYQAFGFTDFHIELSTMPIKHIGTEQIWETATTALQNALVHQVVAGDVRGIGAVPLSPFPISISRPPPSAKGGLRDCRPSPRLAELP
jgi:hypothetical protein